MTYRLPKQAQKLLEQQHPLPYFVYTENDRYAVIIYTTLGKISGISIKDRADNSASKSEAKEVLLQLQKYNFYFDYLQKRLALVKERDSIIAEKIEKHAPILKDSHLFDDEIQSEVDKLAEVLQVFDEQQYKLDLYQEDISLLNEKITTQQQITSEDQEAAEKLAIDFGTAAYAQSIYLLPYRKLRKSLHNWMLLNQKQLPVSKRKSLNRLLTLLGDTNAGFVFDHIISLIPNLEENLLLDKQRSNLVRVSEFQKEFSNYVKFYKPDITKVVDLLR